MEPVSVVELSEKDYDSVAKMISEFRHELNKLKGLDKEQGHEDSLKELNEYIGKKYPVYIAKSNNDIYGYMVLKKEDTVVWVESIYIKSEYRKQGVAALLFQKAEQIAHGLGNETLFFWVHPNNEKMISFLAKQGYDTLNLIEIRKTKAQSEKGRIRVGKK